MGRLDYEAADEVVFTPSERPHQPFRPADPTVDGKRFVGPSYVGPAVPPTLTVTWRNRNRLAEDAVAYAWDRASTTVETGQTTTVRFRDAIDGGVETEFAGLTGTQAVIDITPLAAYRFYTVEVLSERDGIESYRSSDVSLELVRLGYGNNYGYDYGENDDVPPV
ncbi:hypothetical protein ACM25O_13155 [Sulfitobacter pontiacus]